MVEFSEKETSELHTRFLSKIESNFNWSDVQQKHLDLMADVIRSSTQNDYAFWWAVDRLRDISGGNLLSKKQIDMAASYVWESFN